MNFLSNFQYQGLYTVDDDFLLGFYLAMVAQKMKPKDPEYSPTEILALKKEASAAIQ